MSLFAMLLFGMRSLLSNDREARTSRYKKPFGSRRKMVASDSTFARVLRRLYPDEVKQFLLGFLASWTRCISPSPRTLQTCSNTSEATRN